MQLRLRRELVRSTPGVATALVGMSRAEHVDENLELITIEPASHEQFMELFSS